MPKGNTNSKDRFWVKKFYKTIFESEVGDDTLNSEEFKAYNPHDYDHDNEGGDDIGDSYTKF